MVLDRARLVIDQATDIAYPEEAVSYARFQDARLEFGQVGWVIGRQSFLVAWASGGHET